MALKIILGHRQILGNFSIQLKRSLIASVVKKTIKRNLCFTMQVSPN